MALGKPCADRRHDARCPSTGLVCLAAQRGQRWPRGGSPTRSAAGAARGTTGARRPTPRPSWSGPGAGDALPLAGGGPLPAGRGAGHGRHRQDRPRRPAGARGWRPSSRWCTGAACATPRRSRSGWPGPSPPSPRRRPSRRTASRRGWRCCWSCCGRSAACWCWTTWRPSWSRRAASALPGGVCGLRGGAAAVGRERAPELPAADRAGGAARVGLADAGCGRRCGRCGWEVWGRRRAGRCCRSKGLVGDDAAWEALVARYGGNPLALSVVGETISGCSGATSRPSWRRRRRSSGASGSCWTSRSGACPRWSASI